MLKLKGIVIDNPVEIEDIEYINKKCCENCIKNKNCEIQEKVKIDFEYCSDWESKKEEKK